MDFNNNLLYSIGIVKSQSISQNTIVDTFKKLFNIPINNKYQYNEITVFYKELLSVSKQLELGDNITIETVYDGKIPEKVFTIHSKISLDKKQKFHLSQSIHKSMRLVFKSKGLETLFKDAYILIK